MDNRELVAFLLAEVEPLADAFFGNRFRAAAYLRDGTFLPCVVFQSRRNQVDLACRRFHELRREPKEYRSVVETFVSKGSHVASWAIDRVELSPFAWPAPLLNTIKGETTMGWTAFVVEMADGRRFSYGTEFNFEFFDLPAGYSHSNIKLIHSGMVHTEECGTQAFSALNDPWTINCLRERQHFTCFLDGLDSEPENKPSRWKLKFW